MAVTCMDMLEKGLQLIDKAYERRRNLALSTCITEFKRAFGSHPLVKARVFHDVGPEVYNIDNERKVGYFLICCYWMRNYPTEEELKHVVGNDEDTNRAWCWYYAEVVQVLKDVVIKFPDSINHPDLMFPCAVDGVHCQTFEPQHPTMPIDSAFSSKKFGKKAGLAYELAISTTAQQLCWCRGPYPAGCTNDIIMFQNGGLQHFLLEKGKVAIADAIYSGQPGASCPRTKYEAKQTNTYKRRARAKMESFNGRLKTWKILSTPFRTRVNRMERHKMVFETVLVFIQYGMSYDSPIFEV